MTEQQMITLIIVLVIAMIGITLVAIVSIVKAKNATKKTFHCPYCEKEFSPTLLGAMGAGMNFGDESVLVRCTHCGKKDRMIPTDIR